MSKIRLFIILLVVLIPLIIMAQGDITGKWMLIPAKSSEIGLYETVSIDIVQNGTKLMVIQKWGTQRGFSDTLELIPDGREIEQRIENRVFPTNVFMGLSMPVNQKRKFKAEWAENGKILKINENFNIHGSQGLSPVNVMHEYSLSPDQELLIYKITRSTRQTGPPVQYVFKKKGVKEAYFMRIEDNWEIKGTLDQQACLISLQGLANMNSPQLYLIYPKSWPFNYTESVYEFYRDKRNYSFTELKNLEQALDIFINNIKGYVVWDPEVRTSLIVSFTVAGLEKAVVVSERLIPLMEKKGLKPVMDFRGKFAGQTDAQIYNWAYNEYWRRCNKEFIVWLGGDAGPIMKPGVADWGVYKQVFFNDLSTKPEDKEEYALANKILSEMKPGTIVMGWHSYVKDRERDHVKLTSSYGFTVEGLHTLPNFSFNHQIPFSKGFKMKNNHHIEPGKQYVPANKVYISCVQTDGLGIGAWLKPGRGEIPYAWEVIMNYVWLAPGMLEYFYSLATPNDYFIGCLSGPGYMYPKAVPPKLLPGLISRADELMHQLDLNVFEIMDYSEGATVEGNTELTKEVVDAYYKGMPEAIGFINGYAPAYTFTCKDKRPLISYDYYLSPTRPEDDAVADLKELAAINKQRPYFLLMHVRESSDVKRVKGILDKLGPDFELVPVDLFLKMAGENATFKERFLKR
ncbi:hypothetical protein JW964_13535 [candidate division KSB1 bacterium]|nr:hypothetical protein [candidate division KSB1 bacterium]